MTKDTEPTQAKIILQTWLNAVNSGNLEAILALYDSTALLIPTFDTEIKNTHEKRKNYFVTISQRQNLAVALEESSVIEQKISEKSFVLGGKYLWTHEENGNIIENNARFTFVLDLSKPKPIIHHHSSALSL